MQHLQNIVNHAIIMTLKSNGGLFTDSKGKIKFNKDSFNKNLSKKLSHGLYPAHIVTKTINDALFNIKSFKEYQLALEHINQDYLYYDNVNTRRIAYNTNISQLLGF